MLRRLYDWTVRLAESPRATWALAAVSFAESSFFLVPPDVMLAPMAIARPERAYRYALICTIASVLGGIAGYAIGHLLFESVGLAVLRFYGLDTRIDAIKAAYNEYGAYLILIKGFTPIPFKLVTIVSGALAYPFLAFVVLSVITRGARFFLLAFLFNRYGGSLKMFIERNLTAVAVGTVAIIIGGFVLVGKMI